MIYYAESAVFWCFLSFESHVKMSAHTDGISRGISAPRGRNTLGEANQAYLKRKKHHPLEPLREACRACIGV